MCLLQRRSSSETRPAASPHAERGLIRVEDHFLLAAIIRVHLPQADDLAHDLRVVAHGFGLGVNVADVVGDALFLFFEALDAFDQQAQAVVGRFGHEGQLQRK
ncbi:conserved hypothetical protein [Erythrobacter sp. EC-HK427]|nr:conserved hypothetical protein [Erythrobacter sp. EC-HK427]